MKMMSTIRNSVQNSLKVARLFSEHRKAMPSLLGTTAIAATTSRVVSSGSTRTMSSRSSAATKSANSTPTSSTTPRFTTNLLKNPDGSYNPREFYFLPVEERASEIKLLVCDMAGTTIDEGGLVYTTLQASMNEAALQVTDDEMLPWHGAQKREVIEYFVRDRLGDTSSNDTNTICPNKNEKAYYSFRPWSPRYKNCNAKEDGHEITKKLSDFLISKIDEHFEKAITEAYFSPNSDIKLIHPKLLDSFENLRMVGCKIALNTGYPKKIQNQLMKKLGFMLLEDGGVDGNFTVNIDAAVCAQEVPKGRPSPFMVQECMKQLDIWDCKRVAKAGDTIRDIEEGLNSGCGLTIGVLSGAGTRENLQKSGADIILENIIEFEKIRCQQ